MAIVTTIAATAGFKFSTSAMQITRLKQSIFNVSSINTAQHFNMNCQFGMSSGASLFRRHINTRSPSGVSFGKGTKQLEKISVQISISQVFMI